ncbi:hypothetical protein EB796_008252 [Bugula neritina]|uniref:Uncharacterized protein n=1 Tax=Bugula neritina TaxID=10212 RepID=A0A7J7K482_BUGNE|nr:hypothetical protein EB796_008252 [Bugula neritina]
MLHTFTRIQNSLVTSQITSRLLNVSLVTLPCSLTFISKHETNGQCVAAHHRQDGDILIGTDNGIQLLSRDGNELSEYSTSVKKVTGVIETPQNVFILHREGDISKVEMCLAGDITKRQQLFQFDRTSNTGAVMAVSDRYVAVNHPDTRQLIIYDFITKQTETIHPDVPLLGLHFLPDGHLLGVGGGKLMKYKVENGKLTTVWTCDGVTDGYSVCTDANGLIYVSGQSLKSLYIISLSGVLLKTLTHDKLPSLFAGVPSIRDGILAVPGWGDKKVYLFKIET